MAPLVRPRINALTILVLVLVSATFHTLIRHNLQSSLHMSATASSAAGAAPPESGSSMTVAQVSDALNAALSRASAASEAQALSPPQLEPVAPRTEAQPLAQRGPSGAEQPGDGSSAQDDAAADELLTTAATSGDSQEADTPLRCVHRLRLMLWNLQQQVPTSKQKKEGRAEQQEQQREADVARAVAYASARQYDVVAFNELAVSEETLSSIAAANGFKHAKLLRGQHPTSLGFVSRRPFVPDAPAREAPATDGSAGISHGLLCSSLAPSSQASPDPPMPTEAAPAVALPAAHATSVPAFAAGAGEALHLCLTHITATNDRARLSEVAALIRSLPHSPTLLLGDLNSLSPLDFASSTTAGGSAGTTGAASSESAAAAATEALARAAKVLIALQQSRKHRAKFLTPLGEPAVGSMRALLRAGYRDIALRTTADGATCCFANASAGAAPGKPPTSTGSAAASDITVRIDYAMANQQLRRRCGQHMVVNGSTGEGQRGLWARLIPLTEMNSGLAAISEHRAIEVLVGEGQSPWFSFAEEADNELQQRRAGSAASVSPLERKARTPKTQDPEDDDEPNDPAYRLVGDKKTLKRGPVDGESKMPGGLPRSRSAGVCENLGEGRASDLERLRNHVEQPHFVRRCQALSALLPRFNLTRRFRSCAVVGGSGILAKHPKGAEIDAHEAIIRVNNCPVIGFEQMVGSRTTVRFLNGPRSLMWLKDIRMNKFAKLPKKVPPELLHNDIVVVWGSEDTATAMAKAMRGFDVVRANTQFRRQCAEKTFWSVQELAAHKLRAYRFEITFGFEAVAHAIYNCDRVSIYGFFLDPGSDDIWKNEDSPKKSGGGGSGGGGSGGDRRFSAPPTLKPTASTGTPYHYYENASYDKSAKDPTKPWTYKFHNFELEHRKYRQLESACWLDVVNR